MTKPRSLSVAEFQTLTAVSRETLTRLETYEALLRKWQKALNLVSENSLSDVWRRHMLDSAQLSPLLPQPPSPLLDLGSGAGFPGLVLAILGVGEVLLAESDSRKCVFLREVIRATGINARVVEGRIEDITAIQAKVITARGLAALDVLLAYADRLLAPGGVCLILKGRRVEEELTKASKGWMMHVERFPSQTESGGWILRLGELSRVRPGKDGR